MIYTWSSIFVFVVLYRLIFLDLFSILCIFCGIIGLFSSILGLFWLFSLILDLFLELFSMLLIGNRPHFGCLIRSFLLISRLFYSILHYFTFFLVVFAFLGSDRAHVGGL